MRRLILLLLALLLVSPAAAFDWKDYDKGQRLDIRRFAVNNGLFTLYHEVGHLLIDKLELPVLGREEDAADNIATWMLLQKGTPEANQALEDAVQGWALTAEYFDDRWTNEDFASGYSPDRQRAMQIVCLLVGADGAAFRPVADDYALNSDRQHMCHFEYELIDRSMRQLLAKAASGTEVTVVYHDSGRHLKLAEQMLRNSGIIETVAEEVRRGYRLGGEVTMTVAQCGEPNAFYDTASAEIIFCYELMQDFVDLYADELPRQPTGKKPKSR
ncbi:DUF4344 domain-containing metallopeptidase [Devosia rhizoryzae]|uniref:Metallopeptidase n=1 Tax=Devosia rhizoryzae TaxID=2774137 RepID=A0ABX7CA39_9HYPH|nr:DUF4344 domain-containing metallopeptidase [Devosia rhizoryzae]QQR40971.1 hypothetical protein JI748_08335 [Devosia rhizoryzae]